jgi:hypothetical protein
MASIVSRMIRVSSFDCDIKAREWGSFLIDREDLFKPGDLNCAKKNPPGISRRVGVPEGCRGTQYETRDACFSSGFKVSPKYEYFNKKGDT